MELTEGCIAAILCRTTPLDVARLSSVSKIFRSAADSNKVWDHFLPSDYHSIISQSPSLANAPSKKALYLALSDCPIIIDQGKKSFQLDRKNGKKSYMLSARALSIARGDYESYPHWVILPESRFKEVARLKVACWYDIWGQINIAALSPNTQYSAFLVFKLANSLGFHYDPVLLSVGISGGHICSKKTLLDPSIEEGHLDNRTKVLECPNMRSDGLLEIEMGEFFNSGSGNDKVEMTIMMTGKGYWNGILYLEGIEVRPKTSGSRRNSI
ncbi:putative F-box protein PP2-B12 [Lotus japonicus]|uniref:putative F-box protein PP2-B12 n=1 Tax=Lotus japonicus TaxID=34305 RepID=UPI00258D989E|nr:putative F-box protein PP2-B12 [Lotus japonicus]